MCGICGIAVTGGASPSAELLDRMCGTMEHRGPDDQGLEVADGVGLAMRRLSIIDLDGGHQPIHNEDASCRIVFNGELYNYRELGALLRERGHRFTTRSDTEVVLHSYDEWGDDFVSHLNGMFGLAIWDRRRRELVLARDRVGIKPLHYAQLPGRLIFGSEIKALLADPELSREVDPAALADYLVLEYVPTPRSMLSQVRKLPPGHVLRWRQADGGLTLRQYWDVDLSASENGRAEALDADACAEQVRDALEQAVRRELVADVPIGVFLSGGLDSSAVAAMAVRQHPERVRTFSIGFSDPSFDESGHARRVAAWLGTDHRELILEPSMLYELVPEISRLVDEPMADASIVPTYLLSRFTRQEVKVALGGDGGDELFAGYPTVFAHRLAALYSRLPGPIGSGLVPALVSRLPVSMNNLSFDFKARRFVGAARLPVPQRHARWMGSFSPESVLELVTPELRAALSAEPAGEALRAHGGARPLHDPLNQVLYLDMKMYLESDILVKLDRATMMASLEGRVPLLNAEFVEVVSRLPIAMKLRGASSKWIWKRALRGLLPDDILQRPKKGFGIPVGKWFRGPLRGLLLDTLSRERVEADGLLSWTPIERLLEDHFEGRADRRKELWTLFMFQRWHDTWVRGPQPAAVSR
jgi:asparagine synthase (glutamine-hydrolysing)